MKSHVVIIRTVGCTRYCTIELYGTALYSTVSSLVQATGSRLLVFCGYKLRFSLLNKGRRTIKYMTIYQA